MRGNPFPCWQPSWLFSTLNRGGVRLDEKSIAIRRAFSKNIFSKSLLFTIVKRMARRAVSFSASLRSFDFRSCLNCEGPLISTVSKGATSSCSKTSRSFIIPFRCPGALTRLRLTSVLIDKRPLLARDRHHGLITHDLSAETLIAWRLCEGADVVHGLALRL